MAPEGIGMSDHGKHGNALRATRKEVGKKSAPHVPVTSRHGATDMQGLAFIIVPHHNLIRLFNDVIVILMLKLIYFNFCHIHVSPYGDIYYAMKSHSIMSGISM